MSKSYGIELILDLHKCDKSTFTKNHLSKYLIKICKLIKMKRYGKPLFWVDYSNIPHLRGISAVQFIKTSDIVIHAIELLEAVYINIFSCKNFNAKVAERFTKDFFKAKEISTRVVERI